MGIRLKLLIPFIAYLFVFGLFLHFYWADRYLEHEYRDYKEIQENFLDLIEDETIKFLVAGDFENMFAYFNRQIDNHNKRTNLNNTFSGNHKKDWKEIIISDPDGKQIFPLKKTEPISGRYIYKYHRPLKYNNQNIGNLILTVDWRLERNKELQHFYNLEKFIILTFLIIILISIFLQNTLIRRPLLQLKHAATMLAKGDYITPIPSIGKDEIGQLTESFEKMRTNLKKSKEDHEQAIKTAQHSESINRAIINTMADAVITINDHGNIESFNPAAERIFGYDSSEVLNKNINILMPEPHASAHDGYLKRYHNEGDCHILCQTVEVEALHKNGKIINIELSVSDVDYSDPHIFSGIIRDITEHKRKETELRIAAIAFDAQEGILITDICANILRVNKSFTKITGYEPDEVIGRNPNILKSGHQTHEFYTEMWANIKQHGSWSGEIWNKRKNNEIYPQWISITAVKDKKGNVTHYVGSFLDLSDIKEKELQLVYQAQQLSIAKDEAETAAKAKSEFLSVMSHEIRTPLNGIMGMAQLLTDAPLNKEQQEYVQIIINSGNALLTIINDILDFSKIDAKKMELEERCFSLDRVAFEVIHLLDIKAKEKNLELIYDYKSDTPQYFVGDQGRVRQILINLIGNAVKFTEHGYVRLEISCEKTKNIEHKNIASLVLKVEDSGIGIHPIHHAQLFDSFSQADRSTTRNFGGTGLGLTICKKLVELMEGDIHIESEPDKGSIFLVYIDLPIYVHENSKIGYK